MNQGFFSQDKLTVKRPLPPVLKIKVPAEVKKEKKDVHYELEKPQLELDIECYINYFLVKFKREDGVFFEFEMIDEFDVPLDRVGINRLLKKYEIVTFNGNHYDLSILKYALQIEDCTNDELKERTNEIIRDKMVSYKFNEKYDLQPIRGLDHIDLKSMAPKDTSLKLCAARLHAEKIQELPYPEESVLTEKQMNNVNTYCGNDLDCTTLLKENLAEEIQLRRVLSERYGVNLKSKSDAQSAEAIIKEETFRRKGKRIKKSDPKTIKFLYKIPEYVKYQNEELNNLLDILETKEFVARPVKSGITAPFNDLKIQLGYSKYSLGIGGLHSTEKKSFHLSDDEYDYWDFDVTSYYPEVIVSSGLFPLSVGPVFLDIFEEIKDERIEAKHLYETTKDEAYKSKADSMKIFINGTFGKTGSPFSFLYAPDLMIQVTLTGQLAILMLIESLELRGFSVVSGNTDGIVIKCKRTNEKQMHAIVSRWQKTTGFNLESTRYAGLYSRDVNNYIAIEHNGKTKLKGCFAPAKLKRNPEVNICTDALVAYFKNGTPIETTIRECKDIKKFLAVRQVNGGAVKDGKFIGKVVRWYYSNTEHGCINYKTNNNKVPQSDGARPIMDLRVDFPSDINYNWYINKCGDLFGK